MKTPITFMQISVNVLKRNLILGVFQLNFKSCNSVRIVLLTFCDLQLKNSNSQRTLLCKLCTQRILQKLQFLHRGSFLRSSSMFLLLQEIPRHIQFYIRSGRSSLPPKRWKENLGYKREAHDFSAFEFQINKE